MKNQGIINSFTKLPNGLVDDHMRAINPSAYKILILIVRQTIGYRKSDDKISTSQFVKKTGLSENTVKKSVQWLLKNGYIIRIKNGTSYSYHVNHDKFRKPHPARSKSNSAYTNSQNLGSTVSQVLPPLNKGFKEKVNKTNNTTSNITSDDIKEIIANWNKLFDDTLNFSNTDHRKMVINALSKFSKTDLIKAMNNRSKAWFYKKKYPHLRNRPESFFQYPKTIQNDMKRHGTSKIYTYQKKVSLITEQGYREKDFKIRRDLNDDEGHPKWELIKT